MPDTTKEEINRRLTPRQIEVLALVSQRFSSKEIGRQLNLSPKTIDRHVEEINGRLGVSSRSEAGRVFLEMQAPNGEQLPMGAAKLAPPDPSAPPVALPEQLPDDGHGVMETSHPSLFKIVLGSLRLPPVGGRKNDLSVSQRMTAIGRIAFASMIVVAALVAVISGVFQLLTPK